MVAWYSVVGGDSFRPIVVSGADACVVESGARREWWAGCVWGLGALGALECGDGTDSGLDAVFSNCWGLVGGCLVLVAGVGMQRSMSSLHMHVLGRRQKVTHLAHAVPVWLVEQEKNIDGTTSDRPFAVEPDDKSRQVPVAPIGQRRVAWGPSVGCSGLQWASVGTLAPPPAAPGLDYGASNVPVWSGSMSALNLD